MFEATSPYLIGCGEPVALLAQQPTATAQTMGFKAYNLLRMAQINLPIPPAFVLGTAFCQGPQARAAAAAPSTWAPGLNALQGACKLVLGDPPPPAAVCSIGCTRFDAGDDGNAAQHRAV
jgi:pyruvate,orthophosphate dikinase